MAKKETKTKIKPLAGYVLIKPAPKETKTASGIVLPDTADEKPQEGIILACGPDTIEDGKKISCPVKAGDTIVYKKWGGNEIKIDGKELLLLKFEDLMAVVTK
jgi:chaperonin GroES